MGVDCTQGVFIPGRGWMVVGQWGRRSQQGCIGTGGGRGGGDRDVDEEGGGSYIA